jgi:tetratricopeptide (TPR) repeat protein
MRHIRSNLVNFIGILASLPVRAQTEVNDLIRRGVSLQQSGDLAGAAEAYRSVLKLQPDDVATHVNLGVVLVGLGHFDDAIAEYDTALKLLPSDPRIELNLALAYAKSGRIREAAQRFEALHKASPQDDKLTMLLADCDLQLGENDRVIELLQPLNAEGSQDLGVAYMLGLALLRKQRIQEGQVLLDRILRNGDTAESRFLLGTRMFESGDYPAAVKQLASAIELNPKLPGLQSLYGQALLITGDPDAAAAAFRQVLSISANDYAANLGLGQILTARRNYDEASPYLKRALELRPESAEAKASLERKVPPSRDAAEQPQVGEFAPAFSLPDSASGKMVSLNSYRGKSPVVLVLGSYTCPNFRSAAEPLKAMQHRYGNRVPFLLVYIREAHAADSWQSTRNEREGVDLRPAKTLAEKQGHAVMCSRKLHLPFPALVDNLDGAAETAYNAWPSRAFIIGEDGRIRYTSRLTEIDFHPEEMDSVLAQLTKHKRAERR